MQEHKAGLIRLAKMRTPGTKLEEIWQAIYCFFVEILIQIQKELFEFNQKAQISCFFVSVVLLTHHQHRSILHRFGKIPVK